MFTKLFVFFLAIIQTTCELDQRVITTLKYSKSYVQPTVVHGKPARGGQIPYLVSIKESTRRIGKNRMIWHNMCGGSIISDFKVLTAAHCFEKQNFLYSKNPHYLRIVAGNLRTVITHSGRTETNIMNQWRNASKIVLNEGFNFPNNDLALVFVSKEWIFRSNVNYIAIASKNTDYSQLCMAAGFGRTGYGKTAPITPILLIARIATMPRWRCSRLWEINMNTFICSASSFSDVSIGDSGGPLACKNTQDPNETPNRDLLVGVVSGKNFDKTTLYTRVSAYHDWIDSNRGHTLSISFCFLITIAVLIKVSVVLLYFAYIVCTPTSLLMHIMSGNCQNILEEY